MPVKPKDYHTYIENELVRKGVKKFNQITDILINEPSLLYEVYCIYGDVAIKYGNSDVISLQELLCYSDYINQIGVDLPPIPPVIKYFECNALLRIEEVICLKHLPLWVYKISSHTKLRMIECMADILETYEDKSEHVHADGILSGEHNILCSFDDISELFSKHSDGPAVDTDSVHLQSNKQIISDKKMSAINKTYAMNHIQSMISSLSLLEMNSLTLKKHTIKAFVANIADDCLVLKLFSITDLIVSDLLANKNFHQLKHRIKLYVHSQHINNINVLLFKLFFNEKVVLSHDTARQLIFLLCVDCLLYFVSKQLFGNIDVLLDLLEENRCFHMLIVLGLNRITEKNILLSNILKKAENNHSAHCNVSGIPSLLSDKSGLSIENTFKFDIEKPKHSENSTLKASEHLSITNVFNECCCPFANFICSAEKRFKHESMELDDYIMFTLRTKNLSQEEIRILAKYNLFSHAKMIGNNICNQPREDLFNIEDIKSSIFNVKYLNHYCAMKTDNIDVYEYLLSNMKNMSTINRIKTLSMVFNQKIFCDNDFMDPENVDSNMSFSEHYIQNDHEKNDTTFHSYINNVYNELRPQIKTIMDNINARQVREILSFPYTLNFLIPYINIFAQNLKKFYNKITYHAHAYQFLKKINHKNTYVKLFVFDKTYDILYQLMFISKLKRTDMDHDTCNIILDFFLNRVFGSEFVEETHILHVKETLDLLLTTDMDTKIKKSYDSVLFKVKQYTSAIGANLRIRNVQTIEK